MKNVPDNVCIQISDEALYRLLLHNSTNSEAQRLINAMNILWTGSCYGMSSVSAILFADRSRIKLSELPNSTFPDDTVTHNITPVPHSSKVVEDLINYYQLTWYLNDRENYGYTKLKKISTDYSAAVNDLILSIQDTSVPTLVCVTNYNSAHAILVLDIIAEFPDYYLVKCVDPDYADSYTEMKIYKNKDVSTIDSEKYISISYDNYQYLFYYTGFQ